jgi:hypothetical protein
MDREMVEFCDLLSWIILWKLDAGEYDGWNRLELVGEYTCYLCQSAHIVDCHVFQ